MKKLLRALRRIVLSFLGVWVFFSGMWFAWYQIRYIPLSKNMTEVKSDKWYADFDGVEYTYTDADGYQFSMHTPAYLTYSGQMYLTYGAGDDYRILVIQPIIFTGFKYLVQFGDTSQAVVTDYFGHLSSSDSEYKQITENHQEGLNILLDKAKVIWPTLK